MFRAEPPWQQACCACRGACRHMEGLCSAEGFWLMHGPGRRLLEPAERQGPAPGARKPGQAAAGADLTHTTGARWRLNAPDGSPARACAASGAAARRSQSSAAAAFLPAFARRRVGKAPGAPRQPGRGADCGGASRREAPGMGRGASARPAKLLAQNAAPRARSSWDWERRRQRRAA